MKKYLFLDDLRNPEEVTWVVLPQGVDWVIVRSYNDAIRWVEIHGWPVFVAFDHDLGEFSATGEEKTGYDFAHWLVNYALDGNLMPANFNFVVHSMNHVGGKRITYLLNSYIQHR